MLIQSVSVSFDIMEKRLVDKVKVFSQQWQWSVGAVYHLDIDSRLDSWQIFSFFSVVCLNLQDGCASLQQGRSVLRLFSSLLSLYFMISCRNCHQDPPCLMINADTLSVSLCCWRIVDADGPVTHSLSRMQNSHQKRCGKEPRDRTSWLL